MINAPHSTHGRSGGSPAIRQPWVRHADQSHQWQSNGHISTGGLHGTGTILVSAVSLDFRTVPILFGGPTS